VLSADQFANSEQHQAVDLFTGHDHSFKLFYQVVKRSAVLRECDKRFHQGQIQAAGVLLLHLGFMFEKTAQVITQLFMLFSVILKVHVIYEHLTHFDLQSLEFVES
jgi:predicted AlkP superfamily phosphohydrolase/phosphomutase